MTERERWIVYPLLFLALGAALRDKLFDRTTSKSIVCQELTVVDSEPVGNRPARVLARLGRSEPTSGEPASGYLVVNGQVEVDGVINARQYRYHGVPFVPALPMGVSWSDLLRALQQAAQNQGGPEANRAAPQSRPRSESPQPQPPQSLPPRSEAADAGRAVPLADPAENR
jgi:hypothetical protein